jgi:hypothetical protein
LSIRFYICLGQSVIIPLAFTFKYKSKSALVLATQNAIATPLQLTCHQISLKIIGVINDFYACLKYPPIYIVSLY